MSSKMRITNRPSAYKITRHSTRQNDHRPNPNQKNDKHSSDFIGNDEQSSSTAWSRGRAYFNHSQVHTHGLPLARGGLRRSRSVPEFHRASPEKLRQYGLNVVTLPTAVGQQPERNAGTKIISDVPDSLRTDHKRWNSNSTRLVILTSGKKRYGFSLACVTGSDREILPSSNELTFPTITGIIDKSIAHKAGLLPKDVILEINETNVANASFERCLKLMSEDTGYLSLNVFSPTVTNGITSSTSRRSVNGNGQSKQKTAVACVRSVPKPAPDNKESIEVSGFSRPNWMRRCQVPESQMREKPLVDRTSKLSAKKKKVPTALFKVETKHFKDFPPRIKRSSASLLKHKHSPGENQDVSFTPRDPIKKTEGSRKASSSSIKLPFFRHTKEPFLRRKDQEADCTLGAEDNISDQDVTRIIFPRGFYSRPRLVDTEKRHSTNTCLDLQLEGIPSTEEYIVLPKATINDATGLDEDHMPLPTDFELKNWRNESSAERIHIRDDDSGINGSVFDGTVEYDPLLCEILRASAQRLDDQYRNDRILERHESNPQHRLHNDRKETRKRLSGALTKDSIMDDYQCPHDFLDTIVLPPPPEFSGGSQYSEITNL